MAGRRPSWLLGCLVQSRVPLETLGKLEAVHTLEKPRILGRLKVSRVAMTDHLSLKPVETGRASH